jgi:WD40 repeat protein
LRRIQFPESEYTSFLRLVQSARQIMISLFLTGRSYVHLATALVSALLALTIYADAQRRRPGRLTTGFDDVVFAISFSPDGRTLAIARGADEPSQRFGRIELWDTETGTLRHVIRGFDGPVRSVSFSPDGQTIVSGSSENHHSEKIQEKALAREGSVLGEVKWWDSKTGELKHRVTMPGEGNFSLLAAYSPDGTQLAVAESFRQRSPLQTSTPDFFPTTTNPNPFVFRGMFFSADLRLLDAQTGEPKLKLSTSWPRVALFSPDGGLLAVDNGNEIKLWNVQTGKEVHKLKGFKGRPSTIAFSPDGKLLAVVVTRYYDEPSGPFVKVIANSEVQFFDVSTWKVTLRLPNLGAVNSLAFTPGGRVLVIGGLIGQKDGAIPGVKVWDLQTGSSANLATGGEDFSAAVDLLILSRSGGLMAFRSGPATVKILDTRTGKLKRTFDENSVGDSKERATSRFVMSVKRVVAVAFSADGRTLAGELEQGEIKLWDHRTGEVKKHLAGDDESPSLVVFAADGKTLAEVTDGTLRVWDLTAIGKRDLPTPAGGTLSAIALSPDGQTVAVGIGQDLKLFNVATGAVLTTLARHQGPISRIEFSPAGRRLASADEAGAIEIWDLASGRIEKTLRAGATVTALRFAPDGRTLASALRDYSILLWNFPSGGLQQKLHKHSAVINALAFSPDGQLLASGSDDRTVVIWETASGKSKRTLKGHDQTVTSLAFSTDGSLLACAGGNASVVLWEVRNGNVNRVLR